MDGTFYTVRYWENGLRSPSQAERFDNKEDALNRARQVGKRGHYYSVAECKVIHTNVWEG